MLQHTAVAFGWNESVFFNKLVEWKSQWLTRKDSPLPPPTGAMM